MTFQDLKSGLTSAPILSHPEPRSQFLVEVDVSNIEVGVVLSQRDAKDQKLHLCAFVSRRLLQAEANYDIL